jgi:hypothetical protein
VTGPDWVVIHPAWEGVVRAKMVIMARVDFIWNLALAWYSSHLARVVVVEDQV